jgi:hypothetical protein
MSDVINAVIVTVQMMIIFGCAFFVVYLIARACLPVERGLSKFIWDHTESMKPAGTKKSFKEFSRKYHQ